METPKKSHERALFAMGRLNATAAQLDGLLEVDGEPVESKFALGVKTSGWAVRAIKNSVSSHDPTLTHDHKMIAAGIEIIEVQAEFFVFGDAFAQFVVEHAKAEFVNGLFFFGTTSEFDCENSTRKAVFEST
jgi:hypothetical protein